MIRILHSVSNMDRAGIETMLMNYYRHMDRKKIQFDFLCNKTKPGAYDEEIKHMGGHIFHTPGLNPAKYPKYLKYMEQLFKKYPQYKIVEAHNGALGVYALHAAKKNNIPVRIFHAHGASITKDWKWPIKIFCRSRLKYNINYNFTCGIEAARCYFGEKAVKLGDYEFIPNAIEVDRFLYNEEIRNKIRAEYKLEGKKVIGHVGRFMAQKNHEFIIDLFAEYYKKHNDTKLVLLGDGELMPKMKEKVQNLGIEEAVLFVGNVGNANEWYQAFDAFMLPSVWEGLPVVGVEAQASDLPCLFSDNITKEIGLIDKSYFISTSDKEQWIKTLEKVLEDGNRRNNYEVITENRYNIVEEAKKLQERYIKLYEENR